MENTKRITAIEYFQKLSDQELINFKVEMCHTTFSENSIVRSAINEIYGEQEILVLQIQTLIWPLLEVITTRLQTYSPHLM